MAILSATTEIRDHFFSSASSSLGRAAERIIYALEDCWITFLHVVPHDRVVCGEALCEIIKMEENGAPQTSCIIAPDYGVVNFINESSFFSRTYAQEHISIFVKKGTPMFLITRETTGHEAGTIRGLTPRPTRVMWLRKQRSLKQYQRLRP